MTQRLGLMMSLFLIAACGGGGGDSGLDENERLSDLSDDEINTLCEWATAEQGGAGKTTDCGNEMTVTERYTPIGPDHLWYEATITDPQTFTRPWKISLPLYRRVERNAQLLEFKCVEFAEELMYGHLRKK